MLLSPKNTFQAKATHAAGGMEVKILMYNNTAAIFPTMQKISLCQWMQMTKQKFYINKEHIKTMNSFKGNCFHTQQGLCSQTAVVPIHTIFLLNRPNVYKLKFA